MGAGTTLRLPSKRHHCAASLRGLLQVRQDSVLDVLLTVRCILLGLRVQYEDRQIRELVNVRVQVRGRVSERLEGRVERLELLLIDTYEGVERGGEVRVVIPGARSLRRLGLGLGLGLRLGLG